MYIYQPKKHLLNYGFVLAPLQPLFLFLNTVRETKCLEVRTASGWMCLFP